MTFKSFAQEMYFRYVDECWDCGISNIKPVEEYWAKNKWFIRTKYREEYGKLVKEVSVNAANSWIELL